MGHAKIQNPGEGYINLFRGFPNSLLYGQKNAIACYPKQRPAGPIGEHSTLASALQFLATNEEGIRLVGKVGPEAINIWMKPKI